jgi:hypothetical protein
MSTRRFLREAAVFVGVVGGTLCGFYASSGLSETLHLLCAFGGMAVGGATVDLCLQHCRRRR